MSLRLWWRTRAWRRAANEAIGVSHLAGERQRLGAEVLRSLQMADRQSAGEELPAADHARLQGAVSRLLTDETVRVSLALRYLRGLQQRISFGDYEDAAALRAEKLWAQGYLPARLRTPVPMAEGEDLPGAAEPLVVPLAARVPAELHRSAMAA